MIRERKKNVKSRKQYDENGMMIIAGLFYDVEKKRYFPISMKSDPVCDKNDKREMKKEVLFKKVPVVELLLNRKYRLNSRRMDEMNEYLRWRKRIWKSVEVPKEVKCMNISMKWLYLGYRECVLRYEVSVCGLGNISEVVYSCIRGNEIIDVNGDCILVTTERGVRVLDMFREKELSLCGEYVCVNRYEYEGRKYIIIGGERVCLWSEEGLSDLKVTSKCMNVFVNENEVILGFRDGSVMCLNMKERKLNRIVKLECCIVSLNINGTLLGVCDMKGNCMLCEKLNDREWMKVRLNMKVEKVCCMNASVLCVCEGSVYEVNRKGEVLNRIERVKYASILNEVCVLVNSEGEMRWSI